MTSRRFFLKSSAVSMFGPGTAPAWLGKAAWASEGLGRRKKVLVVVFQRGAVDGLNMVVPFGDPDYYELRPNIAIPKPAGNADTAIDLDGFFGLHPSLASLKPIFDERHLAIVEAVGSPHPTRSHFDAQDYMESGTPGRKAATGGWLNRALPERRDSQSQVRAVSMGSALSRTLLGSRDAIAIDNQASAVCEALEGVKLIQSVQKPANQASYPSGPFSQSMQQIARRIKADIGLEAAFAEGDGWDTHVNEVDAKPSAGRLANLLSEFGQSLAAFYRDLGDRMGDVVLVTISEFGRAARENGNRGTDHGHANVMLVMGGDVRGGKVYGDWPGLDPGRLYQGRDLDVTTDFRDVLGELVSRHLGNRDLGPVFPGWTPRFRNLIA